VKIVLNHFLYLLTKQTYNNPWQHWNFNIAHVLKHR